MKADRTAGCPQGFLVGHQILPPKHESAADDERASLVHEPAGGPAVAEAIAGHHVGHVEHLPW
jgi:hypothetical protein